MTFLWPAALGFALVVASAPAPPRDEEVCTPGNASCAPDAEKTDEFSALQSRRIWNESEPELKPIVDAVDQFEHFLKTFGRKYRKDTHPEEWAKRFVHFMETLEKIAARNEYERLFNKHPQRATHGITAFADWSGEEFLALLGGRQNDSNAFIEAQASAGSRAGNTVDWAPCNANWAHLTTVRDQGSCGQCWAFATAEAVRANYRAQHGRDPGQLSTQYLVDCIYRRSCGRNGVNGCCGGNPGTAMSYIKTHGGIPTEDAYGRAGSGKNPGESYPCNQHVKRAVKVTDVSHERTEKDLAHYVCKSGPATIMVDAEAWSTYTGGVMAKRSCRTNLDHAVLAVGLDRKLNAWIVQNSWGTGWGVTLTGEAAKHDKYFNCYEFKKYCHKDDWAIKCPRTCSPPQPPRGYAFLEYGTETCGLPGEAYGVSTM